MSETIGLVLAAGAATRFGSPKGLATFAGRPLIAWPVDALRAGGAGEVIVVLGAAAKRLAGAVHAVTAAALVAEDWAEGLSASLRAGVTAAEAAGARRVVIALGDQPLLSAAAVSRVLDASRAGADVARASYAGVPGHPTVLSRATFAAVRELRGDAGARRLTGFSTLDVPCDGLGSDADVDTPADLIRLAQSSG